MSTRVTQAEFARRCGVRRQTVHEWIKAGRIRRGDDGLLDLAEAERLRAETESPFAHHQASKRRFAEQKARRTDPGTPAPAADGAVDALNEHIALETLRLHRHKAELARLEIERRAASLVDRAEVEAVLAAFVDAVERVFGAIPARLAPELAERGGSANAIHRQLEGAMRDALVEIADHFARLASEQPTEGGSTA